MKKKILVIITLFFLFFFKHGISYANNLNFEEGKRLFDNKKFKDSKFYFEKDIVFNPKNENSYLYLAKIFKKEEIDNLQKNNIETVLLLNPKNEEAVYLLALLNIKESNYSKVNELIETLGLICKIMCSSTSELQEKLDSSLEIK
tara:strand:- start:461 stop:895 length:435 start_codon:yes stop_codon:yes gene_type:complete